MSVGSEPLLDEATAAFLAGPVSITAASRGPDNVPSLARALGCRASADRRAITLLFAASQAGAFLGDLRANGAIAVVFSRPTTHRTLQLKGADARVTPLEPDHLRQVTAYRELLIAELGAIGHAEPYARTLLACPAADLVAVTFSPSAGFTQTPGPDAGMPIGGAR